MLLPHMQRYLLRRLLADRSSESERAKGRQAVNLEWRWPVLSRLCLHDRRLRRRLPAWHTPRWPRRLTRCVHGLLLRRI